MWLTIWIYIDREYFSPEALCDTSTIKQNSADNYNDQGVMCFTFTSRYILLKVRSSHQRCSIKKVFSCEFCEFFKNIFFTEHFLETASKKSENESFIQFLPGNEPWNGFNARKDLRSMQYFYENTLNRKNFLYYKNVWHWSWA